MPHLAWAADDGVGTPVAPKVLRYAFEVAETSLDPVKINDLYSRTLTPHIFEGLYTYDHLARPVKIKPLTAAGDARDAPTDFRVWTVKIRPGIFFASDPAFKGKRRELVAQDYVYSLQALRRPGEQESGVVAGSRRRACSASNELRERALAEKKPFDYDAEIDGIRALDRYTLALHDRRSRGRASSRTSPRSDLYGAVAREVIEFYGDQAEAHPVGTGPFKLAQWRRSSFLAFERNPDFREMLYDAEPAADDAEGQALLARFKGRRLPMVDRVEISIIEEEQPRWLSFVNGEADVAYRVGYQFAPQAMPNGKVAPNLAKKGMRGFPVVEAAGQFYLFNMEDPVVGGYSAAQVALRRAIGLGIDIAQDHRLRLQRPRRGVAGRRRCRTRARYDPTLQERVQRLRPGARARAARPLWLHRPRRRRLARAARRLAARAAGEQRTAGALSQDLRGAGQEHGRRSASASRSRSRNGRRT